MAESITITMSDQYAQAISKISQINQKFNKDLDGLTKRVQYLNKNKFQLKIDVEKAYKDVAKAKQDFDRMGTAASEAVYQSATQKYDQVLANFGAVSKAVQNTRKEIEDFAKSADTAPVRQAMGTTVKEAAAQVLIPSVTEGISAYITSTSGRSSGNIAGGIFGGAATGAIVGAAGGPVGAVVGGIIGLIGGLISGLTQNLKDQDETFRSMVHETYNEIQQQDDKLLTNGIGLAAYREQEWMQWSNIVGGTGIGGAMQEGLLEIARNGGLDYESASVAAKNLISYQSREDTLNTVEGISTMATALGWSGEQAQVLSSMFGRILANGQAAEADLQELDSMGMDASGYVAERLGVDRSSLAEVLTGVDAGEIVNIIVEGMNNEFAKSAEIMNNTYQGKLEKLNSYEEDLSEARGQGYIDTKKEGIDAQTSWMEKNSLLAEQEQYEIGAWEADMENKKEEYIRNSIDSVRESQDYKNETDAAKRGEMIKRAELEGMQKYQEEEGYKLIEMETDLYEAAVGLASQKGFEARLKFDEAFYSLGVGAAGWNGNGEVDTSNLGQYEVFKNPGKYIQDTDNPLLHYDQEGYPVDLNGNRIYGTPPLYTPKAIGMSRVPYDGYLASLHQGEVIVPASKAGEASGRKTLPNINITVNAGGVSDPEMLAKYIAINFKKAVAKYA